ncbi:hypothetical protein DVH24_026340 [Malus domestica]|uniref:Uncharacterized protein n=1 Tax=Malus domestica TaxID=3750 RepID=A0A498KL97_MALDO|nr:hypothetical protein DVH24_026340 [Malus domestica]
MMGDPLGNSRVSFQKQNHEGVVGAQSRQYRHETFWELTGFGFHRHEAFWELTGFGFHRNSEVKRVACESNPMMGDPLGSSRVTSQKQNLEGVVGAQSEQYRATAELSSGSGSARAGIICTKLVLEDEKILYLYTF